MGIGVTISETTRACNSHLQYGQSRCTRNLMFLVRSYALKDLEVLSDPLSKACRGFRDSSDGRRDETLTPMTDDVTKTSR